MSRRRKKNTLLPKMVGLGVLINAILLPILAHFGAFKAIQGQHLTPVKLVDLPPPKRSVPKKPVVKKRVAQAKPRPAARIAAHVAAARVSRPNPNQPKVVASAGTGAGTAATVDNSGTATPGQLPAPAATKAETPPAPVPTPAPVVPAPIAPKPETPPAPAPTPPQIVEAEAIEQPRPLVPDDLSMDDIHGDFVAVFTVKSDGQATAKMAQSTGSRRLDALALDAANRWKFRPARVGGRPVDSFRRLRVQFYAE